MNSCFEEEFQRTPEQNYTGASTQEPVIDLIQKSQYEHKKREGEKHDQQHVIKVQAFVRSFLTRKKNKQHFRTLFDKTVINLKKKQLSVDILTDLVKKLAFFHDSEIDSQRLIWLSKHIIRNSSELLKSSLDKNVSWYWNIKRIILLNMDSINTSYLSFKTSLRIVEEFTLVETYNKILGLDNAVIVLRDLFQYLAKNCCYFNSLRKILDTEFPVIFDAEGAYDVYDGAPLAKRILELVKRPFSVQASTILDEYNTEIMKKFINTFLNGPKTDIIHKFILPNLSQNQHTSDYIGPDFSLVVLAITHYTTKYNTNLFYSLLMLEPTSKSYLLVIKHPSGREFNVMNYYLDILSSLSSSLAQRQVIEYIRYKNENKDGPKTDSDSEDSTKYRFSYSDGELEILKLCSESLNESFRVNRIIKFVEESLLTELFYFVPVCKLCHCLLLCEKFRLLYKLSLNSKFSTYLWKIIVMTEDETLLKFISTSHETTLSRLNDDFGCFKSLLATFCCLFSISISTLHVSELNDAIGINSDQSTNNASEFTDQELYIIITVLKEVALRLIEIAYPDLNTSTVFHFNQIDQISTWSHLLKVVVSLLRQLYFRDLQKRFCPKGFWSTEFNPSYEKPSNMKHLKLTELSRYNYSPFKGINRALVDLSGKRLTTPEVRTLIVLKEIPFVFSFGERVEFYQGLLFNKIQEYQDCYGSNCNDLLVTVRRNCLYEDAFEKFSVDNEPELQRNLQIRMHSVIGLEETGIDTGGILREFLSELLKTAFNPNLGFFKMTNDNMLYPNPHVHLVHQNFDEHYFFIGRMLGKALIENVSVNIPLAEFFLTKIIGRQTVVDIHNLKSLDSLMYKNLMSLIDYDGDVVDLDLDFTVVNEEFGQIRVEELKCNGANITVTNQNRIEYIHLFADYKLNTQIKKQCQFFKQGLENVISLDLLESLFVSNQEVQVLVSGYSEEQAFDVNELKKYTFYCQPFTPNHPAIILFWAVVNDLTDEQKTKFLAFVTSCSRPPISGFKNLNPPFCIGKSRSSDQLPSSVTCLNMLIISEPEDYETLKKKLLYAIESGAGFETM